MSHHVHDLFAKKDRQNPQHCYSHCNFTTTGAVAFSSSRFGGGTGGIFLDNVNCWGTESRLLGCTHPAIGFHNCDHGDDAGVRCQGIMHNLH